MAFFFILLILSILFEINFGYDRHRRNVRHEKIREKELDDFFQKEYGSVTFPNVQVFDFEALMGRMLSSSYMPNETAPIFAEMIDELRLLFAKYAENDRINVLYDTRGYYSQV